MNIFDESFELARVLDLRMVQHRVSIANIANEETPGYRAKELHFKDALAAARQDAKGVIMHITNARHLMLPIVTTDGRIASLTAALCGSHSNLMPL